MRSSRRGTVRTGNRRQLAWVTRSIAGPTLIANQTNDLDLLADFAVAGGQGRVGMTIMRTHVRMAPITAPALATLLTVGLIVGRNTDVGAGVAGQVSPIANSEVDWAYSNVYVASPTWGECATNNIVIDLRSKRKLENLDDIYLMSLNCSAAITMSVFVRTLVALP